MKSITLNINIPHPCVFWGAGEYGDALANVAALFDIIPDFFVDRNEALNGKKIRVKRFVRPDMMVPVISPSEFFAFDNKEYHIIMTMMIPGNTIDEIEKHGFVNIYTLPNLIEVAFNIFLKDRKNLQMLQSVRTAFEDVRSQEVFDTIIQFRYSGNANFDLVQIINEPNQYFQPFVINQFVNEVFVDGGCFDNLTSQQFFKWSGGGTIYAFEPIPDFVERIRNHLLPNQTLFPYALSDKCETTYFQNAGAGSRVKPQGEIACKTVAFDELSFPKKPTFIKLDVEGSEMAALFGMKNTIEKYHPKLAVCVYHIFSDIITIPYYLMTRYPFYKFYLRHHSNCNDETVLYCIPKE